MIKSDMNNFELVRAAIKFYSIEMKNQPAVEEVASAIGLNQAQFKKVFKQWAGVSPKKFLSTITAEFAKSKLLESQTTLEAAFSSGLSGQGRLYDHMVKLYAMTPGEVKNKGKGLLIHYGIVQSPLGKLIVFFSERGISQLEFLEYPANEHIALFQKKWSNSILREDSKLAAELIGDIFDPKSKSEIKLHTLGSNFELNVWKALINLPSSTLASYGQVARFIGKPTAHRAVANAIGRNPVAFIIPCHRVIRESGLIGGYKWGISRKLAIQGRELL